MLRQCVLLTAFSGFLITMERSASAQVDTSDADNDQRTHVLASRQAWKEAGSVLKAYLSLLDDMNNLSARLYARGDAVKNARHNPSGIQQVSLEQSISHTARLLEWATTTHKAHQAFHKQLFAAEELRKQLVSALETVSSELSQELPVLEFRDNQIALTSQLDSVKDLIRDLKHAPVRLPVKYVEMGRYIGESLVILETALQTKWFRKELSSEQYANAAMTLNLQNYKEGYQKWIHEDLKTWRTSDLPDLYRSTGTNVPTGFMSVPVFPPEMEIEDQPANDSNYLGVWACRTLFFGIVPGLFIVGVVASGTALKRAQ
jgi:hypothetical protein